MRHHVATFEILLAAMSAPALSLTAQQNAVPADSSAPVVRPGDGTVSGLRIEPHTNRWVMTYQLPDGRVVSGGPGRVATWYDSVWVTVLDGQAVLHRRQVLLNPADSLLETIDNWVDRRSLVPIRTETMQTHGGLTVREYRGAHVTGFDPDSTAPGGRRPVDVMFSEPAYDFFGGMYDLLLSGFPLAAGYKVRFPADLGGTKDGALLSWVTITVTGREEIDTHGPLGTVPTWHVMTSQSSIGRFEFWIADKPPYMMRMWYIGPRGGKQVWTVG